MLLNFNIYSSIEKGKSTEKEKILLIFFVFMLNIYICLIKQCFNYYSVAFLFGTGQSGNVFKLLVYVSPTLTFIYSSFN